MWAWVVEGMNKRTRCEGTRRPAVDSRWQKEGMGKEGKRGALVKARQKGAPIPEGF